MEKFQNIFLQYDWERIKQKIDSVTRSDVERVLNKEKKTIEDFLTLISSASAHYLEQMAQISQNITQKRFGKVIHLYSPMYLSNECQNICTYCGFSMDNKIKRRTLRDSEIIAEAMALKSMGINHVLLVSGEANKTVGINYFLNAVKLLKPYFENISLEVQPLSTKEYKALHLVGVYSISIYQETYNQEAYREYHPKGKKSNFNFRLNTPDRIGEAGIHKIGLGVLLGLEDWRVDSFFNALHIDYLQKNYWKTKFSVSFPRIRPAEGIIEPNFIMNERDLLQLICAYRIWNENLEISVSTRENENFRNHIITLGVTNMSAASKTNPGGYVVDPQSLEQFDINDERSIDEIRSIIKNKGYYPVMKDWDKVFFSSKL